MGTRKVEGVVLEIINGGKDRILPAHLAGPVPIYAASDVPSAMLKMINASPIAIFAVANTPSAMPDAPFATPEIISATPVVMFATAEIVFAAPKIVFASADAPSSMAKGVCQMPKTSNIAAFVSSAMKSGKKGVFWPVSAMTGGIKSISRRRPATDGGEMISESK